MTVKPLYVLLSYNTLRKMSMEKYHPLKGFLMRYGRRNSASKVAIIPEIKQFKNLEEGD